jgi:hypothetical protein
VESSPNPTILPSHDKYLRLTNAASAGTDLKMGAYFVGGSQAIQQLPLRCLYCEQPFGERRALNEHYLSVHTEAFSEEE